MRRRTLRSGARPERPFPRTSSSNAEADEPRTQKLRGTTCNGEWPQFRQRRENRTQADMWNCRRANAPVTVNVMVFKSERHDVVVFKSERHDVVVFKRERHDVNEFFILTRSLLYGVTK